MTNKGSFIWDFIVHVAWNDEEDDYEGDQENFTVVAPTFYLAWTKVKKLALSTSRKFQSEDEEENPIKGEYCFPVRIELEKVERGNWIDG